MSTSEQTYRGSCHCGAVRFEVTTSLDPVLRCNCSLCRRKGALMCRVPEASFALTSGQENLGEYRWNTKVARHYFCKTCGIYTHHRPRTAPEVVGFNVGCLDGVDPLEFANVPVNDGAALTLAEPS